MGTTHYSSGHYVTTAADSTAADLIGVDATAWESQDDIVMLISCSSIFDVIVYYPNHPRKNLLLPQPPLYRLQVREERRPLYDNCTAERRVIILATMTRGGCFWRPAHWSSSGILRADLECSTSTLSPPTTVMKTTYYLDLISELWIVLILGILLISVISSILCIIM